MPDVTFVIATYRRADALRCTLQSLVLQDHGDWTALVIGDHCGPETADAVRSVSDARVRYYNLPERFGEQSGPNTAGLRLARGAYVAFLNHDDLLLPDHLTYALETLGPEGEFFIGQCAGCTDADGGRLRFTFLEPNHEDLTLLLRRDPGLFEPSSFWVIRTAFARAVGDWRRAGTIWRPPARDWLLRAWRRRGRFRFGRKVTGLRFLTHRRYPDESPEHQTAIEWLHAESPDAIRARLPSRRPLARWRAWWGGARRRAWRAPMTGLFLYCGIDPVVVVDRVTRRPPGAVLEKLCRVRTGTPLPARPALDAFLRDPDAHRVV